MRDATTRLQFEATLGGVQVKQPKGDGYSTPKGAELQLSITVQQPAVPRPPVRGWTISNERPEIGDPYDDESDADWSWSAGSMVTVTGLLPNTAAIPTSWANARVRLPGDADCPTERGAAMNGPDPSQRWWKRSLAGASLVAASFGVYAWATGTPPQNVALFVAVAGVLGICALFARGEERGWE